MNAKHKKTLAALFAQPIPKSLAYRDVAALLKALDCIQFEAEGSRVVFARETSKVLLHRPHPGKEVKDYQIKKIKAFLEEIGVTA